MGSNCALYDSCTEKPNVQEMVRTNPFHVPERYIRHIGNDIDLRPQLSGEEFPIIDLSLLSSENKEEFHKLDLACKEWGFFQMVNHGVGKEITKGMKESTNKFFELPLGEKNKIAMAPNDIQGYGQLPARQGLDWSDRLILYAYPHDYRKLEAWPPSPLREAIESYSSEMRRIGEELLRSISIIMKLEKEALLDMHQDLVQALSVAYYPPCSMCDRVLGIYSHSDKSTLTVVMQDEDVVGLQIKHKGKWVPINPLPNVFVVNVGDLIEIWINGKYKSVEHRLVTNESKARISYTTFYTPRHDADIEPLDQFVLESPGSLPLYKRITYGDYQRKKTKKEGKGHLSEFAKIAS